MTILYSNGCSFTDNRLIDQDDRYPYLIGKQLGWHVRAAAIAGSCNSRIIRCTMRDCIELLNRNEPIVALIQLTFLSRFEYAGTPTTETQWMYARLDEFESIKPNDLSGLPTEVAQWAKLTALLHKYSAAWSQLYPSIVGLISFFKQHNIRYYVYSGPDVQPFIDKNGIFYDYLKNDPGVLSFKDFNMLDLTGAQKHPDGIGMQTIANYFISLLDGSM